MVIAIIVVLGMGLGAALFVSMITLNREAVAWTLGSYWAVALLLAVWHWQEKIISMFKPWQLSDWIVLGVGLTVAIVGFVVWLLRHN